jgi:hypothetical protein
MHIIVLHSDHRNVSASHVAIFRVVSSMYIIPHATFAYSEILFSSVLHAVNREFHKKVYDF